MAAKSTVEREGIGDTGKMIEKRKKGGVFVETTRRVVPHLKDRGYCVE